MTVTSRRMMISGMARSNRHGILLAVMCACTAVNGEAQTVVVTTDTLSRPMPLIGFNTNAHFSIANWTIPAFRDSTALLKPAILRYPGGTTANYWDWKTGWFRNDSTTPPEFSGIKPAGTVRAEEFKLGIDAARAKALMVINFQHSDIAYQMEGLRHAAAVGIPVEYIEIGNEHNLSISNQFIAPSVYATGAAVWTDSIKKEFTTAQVCLVGGSPPNQPGWNDSLFAHHPNIDALAFHVYLGAGNADSLFNVTRALSVPFAQLNQRFVQSKFPSIPPDVDVWVTEFNLSENLSGTPMQHVQTWTQALYVAAMIHIFLENPKITMIIDHNLTNQLEFAAISPYDYHITANGLIMQLIGEVSKGMTTATRLRFSPGTTEQYGSTLYPSLLGWQFSGAGAPGALIVNLSGRTTSLDLSAIVGAGTTTVQYSADTAAKISGKGSLTTTRGQSGGLLTLRPYAILQVFGGMATVVNHPYPATEGFWLVDNYPNPFNPATILRYSVSAESDVMLRIFDMLGRELETLADGRQGPGVHQAVWNAAGYPSGVYIVRLEAVEQAAHRVRTAVRRLLLLK